MNTAKLTAGRAARTLCALLLLATAFGAARAQTGAATVRGAVRDQQGQAVVGATVTLTNAARNFSRTQVTSDDGTYAFSAVPPGAYRVEVEATGFKKAVAENVNALVETTTDVDVALEVGNVTETITVSTSTEAPLNTTDATIGNAFAADSMWDRTVHAGRRTDAVDYVEHRDRQIGPIFTFAIRGKF